MSDQTDAHIIHFRCDTTDLRDHLQTITHLHDMILDRLAKLEAAFADLAARTSAEDRDEIIGVEGVAKMLGVPANTVYQKTCRHHGAAPELPFYRAGRKLYFKRSDIEAWMTSRKIRSRAELEKDLVAKGPYGRGRRRR